MANLILTEVGWQDRIREKLGVDEAYLPDSAIDKPEVIGIAEANMVARIPTYASLEGASRLYLEVAVVLEAAALLCPTMKTRLPIREQALHFSRDLSVDWDKRRQELMNERDGILQAIDGVGFNKPILWVT